MLKLGKRRIDEKMSALEYLEVEHARRLLAPGSYAEGRALITLPGKRLNREREGGSAITFRTPGPRAARAG